MVEFLNGNNNDLEDIVDFLNYTFSYSNRPHDFKIILPKLYKEEFNSSIYHYLAKENGRIKATVGSFPLEMTIMDETLKLSGIGNVGVHPYARRNGYMKELMNRALEDMHSEGVDLSYLNGQRQRYEYFNYTPSGVQMNFKITPNNIRHAWDKNHKSDVEFLPIDIENDDFTRKALEIYNNKPIRILRDKKIFLNTLRTWKSSVFEIQLNKNFAGYISVSKDMKKIVEIEILDETYLFEVIATYIDTHKISDLEISLPIYEQDKIKILLNVCEKSTIANNYNFNVLNYEKVVRAFLKLKASYTSLKNGNMTIEIENYGTIEVFVENNKINVVKVAKSGEIELNHIDAMQFFFSPFRPLQNTDTKIDLINSWFPLPLFIGEIDGV